MIRRMTWLALGLLFGSGGSIQAEDPVMPGMTTYYFGMLLKGASWSAEETPERVELQKRHLAHLTRLGAEGKLVLAGPLLDDGTIRGLLVYRASSIEEARSWAEADPAVKAGRLKVEMHPWMVRKGILP